MFPVRVSIHSVSHDYEKLPALMDSDFTIRGQADDFDWRQVRTAARVIQDAFRVADGT